MGMRNTFKFMYTFDADVAKSFNVPQESAAVYMPEIFWTEYENKTHVLSKKSATYKEIITFVRTNSLPLVGWRNKRNEFKYSERPLVVIYYDGNYEHQYTKDTQYIRNKVVQVSKNFLGSNLKFAISSEDEYADEIQKLGFEDSGADVNVGCYTEKQKFRMKVTDEFETEDLGEFIEDLRTGKVAPYMKSLPVPKVQDGPVLKIVADNYDTEVHKVKKDAVIFFHAPWCGHCKEFDPIQYQGDRTYKSVKDWINRHSSIFLSEEEKTGQAFDDDEEIESFTAENFEADVATETEEESGKDEL